MAGRKKNIVYKGSARTMTVLEWMGLKDAATLWLCSLLFLILCSGLTVVYLTHKNRVMFTELQQSKDEANALDIQWGQLLIEQSSLGVGGRVEQRAVEDRSMHVPAIENIIMVRDE